MGFAMLYPSYTLGFAAAATTPSVMAGLDPAIHVFRAASKNVDARDI
jgi:hypothetical protein